MDSINNVASGRLTSQRVSNYGCNGEKKSTHNEVMKLKLSNLEGLPKVYSPSMQLGQK